MRDIVLSHSAIQLFDSCRWAYMLKYILGWRQIKDKDHFRIGGHWAKCQEIAGSNPGELCWECAKNREINPDCYLCQGGGTIPEDLMEAVSRYINLAYSDMPSHFNAEQWEVEKLTVLYSFSAYKWRYPGKQYSVLATEIPFSLPIVDPTTGKKISKCRLDGMLDQLWQDVETGEIVIGEQKSTGSSLEDDDFWDLLKSSGQVQDYSYAAYMLQIGGALKEYGLKPSEAKILQPVYDVWHKPTTKPKFLSQGESKKFVEDSTYFNTKFEIASDIEVGDLTVDGTPAEVKPGAKEGTFAIKETPAMYAQRLWADMLERPDFYFARRPIAVHEQDLAEFAEKCAKLVKTIRYIEKENLWTRNTKSCKGRGKCDYFDACYGHRDHPLIAENPPEGFKCHFTEKEE